jgi:hypothetical protein
MLVVLMLKGTGIMSATATKENRLKRPDLTSAGASLQESVSKELTWVRRVAKIGDFFRLSGGAEKKHTSLSAKRSATVAPKKHASGSGKRTVILASKKKAKKK